MDKKPEEILSEVTQISVKDINTYQKSDIVTPIEAKQCMELYASQEREKEAIAFSEFIAKKLVALLNNEKEQKKFLKKELSNEELYKQFKKTKKQ